MHRGHCRGLIEVTIDITMVVIQHFGMLRHKLLRAILDRSDTGNYYIPQVSNFSNFTRVVINDSINVSLLVELVGRYANKFGAFLPGQVVSPNQVGKALRVNGVEHPCSE